MKRSSRPWRALPLLLAIWAFGHSGVLGDDRELLGSVAGDSTLFILLDVGRAMGHGLADEPLPRGADDPDSRLFMAKAALVAALGSIEGSGVGSAAFPNQDGLHVVGKGGVGDRVELESSAPAGSCPGWEPNGDDGADSHMDHSLKWPTRMDGPASAALGDVVPPGAESAGRDLVLGRLGPNLALGEPVPDFGVARYFADQSVNGQHRLLDERARPLVPWGESSLSGALQSFEEWLVLWRSAGPTEATGPCGTFDLLVVVGSPESCPGDGLPVAARLFTTHGVRVHVVALGLGDPMFDAIAAAGGTGAAWRPGTREQLDEELTGLLGQISGAAAGAELPLATGVASGGGLVAHASLLAVPGSSLWSGRVDGYLRPVPLAPDGGTSGPDRERVCDPERPVACRAWDVGQAILEQAPTPVEAAAGSLRLGSGADERRVFYRDRHGQRRLLLPPADPDEQLHLYGPGGFGIDAAAPDLAARGRGALERALATRTSAQGSFLLGDVFHSRPVLIEPPSRLDYLVSDSEGRLEACGPRFDGAPEDRVPYGCFARLLSRRRRMLAVGANDGQLHLFDAGIPGGDGLVDAGSGNELAAFAPRAALKPLYLATLGSGHRYSVDGTVTVDDFLTRGSDGAVREWRTALVGGLRRGGAGYYALDITQPDRLDARGLPIAGSYVPSCLDGGPECAVPSPYPGLPELPGRHFPGVLWEFEDTRDEDGNDAPDLGETWSRPATGRIRTSSGDRFVAVFGGGLDPHLAGRLREGGSAPPWSGNFLYMLDLETGSILYKRPLDRPRGDVRPASVAAGPAAVDLDADGYLDTLYAGTTDGYLFKVEIGSVGELDASSGRIESAAWAPFPVFDSLGEPIYHAAKVLFVAAAGRPAVAFGTGDRQDLWAETGFEGGFYVFVDEGATAGDEPLKPSALEPLEARGRAVELGGNLLTLPLTEAQRAAGRVPGWAMRLAPEERLLAPPVAAGGVLLFNTYMPLRPGTGPACGGGGVSRAYAVVAGNGNGVSGEDRFAETAGVVPTPMVDVALSRPARSSLPSPPGAEDRDKPCDGEAVESLRARLVAELHPEGCSSSQRSLEVVALDQSGEQACRVSLPVCVRRRHWRER